MTLAILPATSSNYYRRQWNGHPCWSSKHSWNASEFCMDAAMADMNIIFSIPLSFTNENLLLGFMLPLWPNQSSFYISFTNVNYISCVHLSDWPSANGMLSVNCVNNFPLHPRTVETLRGATLSCIESAPNLFFTINKIIRKTSVPRGGGEATESDPVSVCCFQNNLVQLLDGQQR